MSEERHDDGHHDLLDLVRDDIALRRLAAGDVLCAEGDPSEDAYVVVEGEIEAVIGAEPPAVVGRHTTGSLVGEVTALVGGRRSATLRAAGDATVAVIPRRALVDALEADPGRMADILRQARHRVDRTRAAAVLVEMLGDPDLAAAIADEITVTTVERGTELVSQGDESDGMYVLIAGRVVIERWTGSTWERLGERHRGDTIGEIGILDGRPRSATVRALRQTTVAHLPTAAFHSVVERHPPLALALARRALLAADRPHRDLRPVAVIGVAVIGADPESGPVAVLADEIERHGSCLHLTADLVDELLGRAGAAEADTDSWIGIGLAEVFHDADATNDHVVLQLDVSRPEWTRRAIDCADRVVVICPSDPGPELLAEVESVLALAPESAPKWLVLRHPPEADRPHGSGELRRRLGVDEVHHVRDEHDLRRVARLATGHGVGVALGGGGARGFAHIGALRALEEAGVPVDRIAGTSIGAALGAARAQGLESTPLQKVVEGLFRRLLDYTFPVVALLKGGRISKAVEVQFGGWDIDDLWVPYRAMSTNLTRSRSEVHEHGRLDHAVRASISIPGVLPPVCAGDELLIDGGVLNNLPVDVLADDPTIEQVIAIDVAPEHGPRARGEFGFAVSGWGALARRVRRHPETYPRLAAVLTRTMLVAAARDRTAQLEAGRVDLLLDLDLRGVGLLEFDDVASVVDRGYELARPLVQLWVAERQAVGSA